MASTSKQMKNIIYILIASLICGVTGCKSPDKPKQAKIDTAGGIVGTSGYLVEASSPVTVGNVIGIKHPKFGGPGTYAMWASGWAPTDTSADPSDTVTYRSNISKAIDSLAQHTKPYQHPSYVASAQFRDAVGVVDTAKYFAFIYFSSPHSNGSIALMADSTIKINGDTTKVLRDLMNWTANNDKEIYAKYAAAQELLSHIQVTGRPDPKQRKRLIKAQIAYWKATNQTERLKKYYPLAAKEIEPKAVKL